MADYGALRQQHAMRMLELAPDLFARLEWSAERLRSHRDAALRLVLAQARAQSPWHGQRLAGIDVERLSSDDLTALPGMTKTDLMQHFDQIVTDARLSRDVLESHLDRLTTDAYLFDRYHVCASGGSSGRRGVFVYDFDAWAITFASYIRFSARMIQQVFGSEQRSVAIIAADKATHMTAALAQTFPPPGDLLRRLPATWPMDRIVATLDELQPDMLMGYTSIIHQLSREAMAGRLRIAPKLIATTSEPLLLEMRESIAAAWPVPLFNGFGSTEGLMGGSCSAGRGIHLSDDLFVIETVDAAGRRVPAGARAAKVYLTSLYNFTQPLIRYELTDEVTVLDEPCACGTTLLRIDDIQGRLDDSFVYPGGATVHPFTFRSLLGREREIIEYQVHQTAAGAHILLRTEGQLDTTHIAESIRSALAAQRLADPAVTVAVVDSLDRASTGKFRRFVPLTVQRP